MKIKTLRLIKTHDGQNPLAPDRRTTLEAQEHGVLMIRDGQHRVFPWSNIMFLDVEPPPELPAKQDKPPKKGPGRPKKDAAKG